MADSITPVPIVPPAGVVKTEAGRVIQGRWIDSNMIRFVRGMPQKRGGWVKAFTTATSGVPRCIHAWRDNNVNNYLAAGTYKKLYIYDQNLTQNDVTPFRLGTVAVPVQLTNPFKIYASAITNATAAPTTNYIRLTVSTSTANVISTLAPYTVSGLVGTNGLTAAANGLFQVSVAGANSLDLIGTSFPVGAVYTSGGTIGSSYVQVTHNSHGLNAGDTAILGKININGINTGTDFGTIGNINPNGNWPVAFVISNSDYAFNSGVVASVTLGPAGGTGNIWYEIPIGSELGAYGLGWGVGSWGLGNWGDARSTSTVFTEPRIWAIDHFGQILLATHNNNGSVYSFDPTQFIPSAQNPWPRAVIVAAAPTDCKSLFITPERFVFALRNGMVVHWSDQNDFTYWTPGQVGHTSQSRTLTEGSKLVSGRPLGPFVSLVWTDGAVYLFEYTGVTNIIYNSRLLARNCGLVAPGAAVTAGGVAYWMGSDTFWMYDGTVRQMPNVDDIKRFVFSQLDTSTLYQAQAVYDPTFQEVEFFFTPSGQTSPQQSVVFSLLENCWSPNTLGRTSGTNYSQGDTRPYLGASNGFIYQHENTNDDDGSALTWSLTLAPYNISEGLYSVDIQGFNHDFFQQSGNITATINGFDYPDDAVAMDSEVDVIAPSSGRTDTRVSGRYISLNYTSSDLGNYMRYGHPVAFVIRTGRRP